MPPTQNTDEAVAFLIEGFVRRKWLAKGDQVVVTAGYPPGSPGKTNLLLVREV
jgi:pyruvate kinase